MYRCLVMIITYSKHTLIVVHYVLKYGNSRVKNSVIIIIIIIIIIITIMIIISQI